MELDKIKSGWQNLDVKSVIDEEKIQNIIRKRGQSAHALLLRWEKLGLVMLVCVVPLCVSFFLSEKLYIAVYFTLACIVGFVWQIYKIKFLKGIDLMNMPVTKVVPKIANYRKYIQNELYVGLVWFVGYIMLSIMSRNLGGLKGFLVAIVGAFGILSILYMYKRIYVNKIKSINQSLEELREFEKEN